MLNQTDFEDTFIVTYLSDEVLDTKIALTAKGEYAVDRNISQSLDWLNENEPKHPNEYPLSKKQRSILLEMNNRENGIAPYVTGCIKHTNSYGAHDYYTMKRLEKRGLIVCVGMNQSENGTQIVSWKLTSAGQYTVYNFAEFLPF